MPQQTQDREFDIVLLGATGFTGRLVAEALAARAPDTLRWALAGRTPARLAQVAEGLAPSAARPAQCVVDVADAAALRQLARRTRVLVTTVGPYLHHGEAVVAACASEGTDYADLCGEPEFVDRMWLAHQATAQRSGARLVHACGFDSIPHDLGAWFTVRQLPEAAPLTVHGQVRASGRFSGGTLHSALNAMSRPRQARETARLRRAREAPPPGRRVRPLRGRPHRDAATGRWLVPLPTIDPQIVLRSAAGDPRYGPAFSYGHWVSVGSAGTALGLLGAIGGLAAGARVAPIRRRLERLIQAGSGPDEAERARGRFTVRFEGRGGGRQVVTTVRGGDPGYGETARMLAETALCLAFDELPSRSGQLTPALAMGQALIDRLQAVGMRFAVESDTALPA